MYFGVIGKMYFGKFYLGKNQNIHQVAEQFPGSSFGHNFQRRARIRTSANFGRIGTGSDCNFLKIGGAGPDRTEKIVVVLM